MMGATAGDVLGSTKEGHPVKGTSFHLCHDRSRLTDDSVLSLAVTGAIACWCRLAYGWLRSGQRRFVPALAERAVPGLYNSRGNGAAMRVSPLGPAFEEQADVLTQVARTAAPTHNHPEEGHP